MKVTQLFIHPVKSLGGVSVNEFSIDRFGPQWDRRWMVVDQQGKFLTQRQVTRMASIETMLCDGWVQLHAANKEPLKFCAEDFVNGEPITVQVWRDQVQASLGTQAMHGWLSDVLGVACRLVFMSEQSQRLVDLQYAYNKETVSFADGFPLLLTTQASLNFLNEQMRFNIDMKRFRPNVVVDGTEPWQEDQWQRIKIGKTEFQVAKPCSRCVIPTINPVTLERQPEVFKTLKRFRSRDGDVFFGQNLIPLMTGSGVHSNIVALGDDVEVLQ